MPLEILTLLENVRQAAELILRFTKGRALEDYGTDEMLRAAVEREFSIVGEALIQLRNLDPAVTDRISDYRRIISFRHHLTHRYWNIDDGIVWGIVRDDVPVLLAEIADLIAEGDPDAKA